MSEMFDELKELKAMLESGEITMSEYDKLKADLLADRAVPTESSYSMTGKPFGWYKDHRGGASKGNSRHDETHNANSPGQACLA